MRFTIPALLLLLTTLLGAAELPSTPVYGVSELTFTGPTMDGSDSPVTTVDFWVEFTHESGSPTYRVHGFWDGNGAGGTTGNVWRVRFCPTETGRWNLSDVFSNRAELNNQREGDYLNAIASANHGFWEVDAASGGSRWYRRSDGSHQFIVGNTFYDFLSRPHGNEASTASIQADIDDCADWFRKVRFCLFSFRSENASSTLRPFLDSSGNPTNSETDVPNPAFFAARVDVAVQRGFERDLICDLIMGGTTGDQIADRTGFIKYIAARYGSYPNVWMTIGQEWNEQASASHQVAKGTELDGYLPYPTPLSTHATGSWNPALNGSWNDHTISQGKYADLSDAADRIMSDYIAGQSMRPGINDENGYDPNEASTDDVLEGITGSFLGGGYGTTGHKTGSKRGGYFWGHAAGGDSIAEHPSRQGLAFLTTVIESHLDFWQLTPVANPADSIFVGATSGFRALEWDGNQYVLGSDAADSSVTAALPTGTFTVTQHNIITRSSSTLSTTASGSYTFSVPGSRACLTIFTKNADAGSPQVSIDPVSGDASRVVALTGSASDDGSVARVDLRIDGGAWVQASGTTNWSYDWVSYHIAGSRAVSVEARVTDDQGNTTTASTTVNIVNPLLSLEPNAVVVCIGDSITAGDAANTDWPSELQTLLNAAGRNDVTVINEGEGGLSSEEFWQDAGHEGNKRSDVAAHATIDLAVVMLGHNDTRSDDATWHDRTPAEYAANMANIVSWLKARSNADGETTEVLVLMPVQTGEPVVSNHWGFPADFNRVMQQSGGYIPRLCAVIANSGVAGLSPLVAFDGGASSYAPWRSGSGSLIGSDTIHPNDSGQTALAALVRSKLDLDIVVDTQPTITTVSAELDAGTVGVAYSDDLEATGGEAPLTWSVVSGSLPAGLSIVGSEITGTPSQSGTASFTVQVTDADGDSDSRELVMQVVAIPTVTITSPANAQVGVSDRSNHLVLVAGANDPEGGTPTILWDLVSGPGTATFADTTAATTDVIFSADGVYELRCTATTVNGSASDTLSVVVGGDGGLVQTVVIASTDFSAGVVSNTNDNLPFQPDDTSNTVGFTGGGRDAASPMWTIGDASMANLAAVDSLSLGAYTWGSAGDPIRYGDLFITATDFGHAIGSTTSNLRYTGSTATEPLVQLGSSAAGSAMFNLVFTIAEGESASDLAVAFRAGTAATSGAWHDNSPDGNGAYNIRIRPVGSGGALGTGFSFYASAQALGSGGGPSVSANDQTGAVLGSGTYVLQIELTGKTRTERYSIDDLSLNAGFGGTSVPGPVVDPGTAPAPSAGVGTAFAGTASSDAGAISTNWSMVSGPGAVSFADATSPATTATFSAAGTYVLRLQGADASATVFEDLSVTVDAAGATRTITIQDGSAGYWEISPADGSATRIGDADRFDGLDLASDYILTPVASGDG